MATAVVSGRVDERVRDRAGAYIRAAGLTQADVIKTVWENIAKTGEVPSADTTTNEAPEGDPFEAFVAFCTSLPEPPADSPLRRITTNQELKEYLAEERLKDYERLDYA